MLDALLGNDALKADLTAALREGRLPHGVLLCGAAGLGRNFAARLLAADYLYPQGGSGAARVLEGASEECLLLSPEGAGNIIPVDKVREVRGRVQTTSLLTDGRVVLIRDAHRMQAPSANALLKLLEEPPESLLFVLTTDSEASILPTIRSRCAVYTLSPVPVRTCAELLAKEGGSMEAARLLCAVYGGAIGSCLKARTKERLASLADARDLLNAAVQGQSYTLLRLTTPLTNKKEREPIRQFLQDTADMAGAALSGVAVPQLTITPQQAATLLPPIQEAMARLAANGNVKLLLTLLCAQLAGDAVFLPS